MGLHQIRRHCEARLHTLPVPTPFDLDVFCARLAAQRGRPILLLPWLPAGEVTGLTIGLSSIDIIVHARAMSRLHQEHIIVHELSHLLCGHQPALVAPDAAAYSLLAGILSRQEVEEVGSRARQHMLCRAGYTTEEEQEVEVLTSLILDGTQRDQPAPPSSERLETVLEEGARHSA